MRLFVALPIPVNLAAAFGHLVRLARLPEMRWTSPENLHLTLVFLGKVAEESVASITTALDSLEVEPVPVRFTGLGVFPCAGVLFAEAEKAPDLLRLRAEVARRTTQCGFPVDLRPYHPHVTLARFHSPESVKGNQLTLPPDIQDGFLGEVINLYRSRQTPNGLRYQVLFRKETASRHPNSCQPRLDTHYRLKGELRWKSNSPRMAIVYID